MGIKDTLEEEGGIDARAYQIPGVSSTGLASNASQYIDPSVIAVVRPPHQSREDAAAHVRDDASRSMP